MVSQSKTIVAGLASLFCGAHGIRSRRTRNAQGQMTIAGVPVHNYRDADDWIILFREGASDESIHQVCGGRCKLEGHPSKGGVAFAQVRGREKMEAIAHEHGSEVELLEPENMDYMIPEIQEFNVAAKSASWGLDKVGVPGRTNTGAGVHIFVQDTGIRATHVDFEGRVVPTIDVTSGDIVECSGAAGCAGDVQGHGTHCAGTAGGKTYGVASGATIHAVKTLNDRGSGSRSWQMAAIDWISVNGARPAVISMSLGGKGQDPSYAATIKAATQTGLTIVVAAGNSNEDSCTHAPAFAKQAITVGATTENDKRADYSNYGSCNNIMAPGSYIVSADKGGDVGDTFLSGTSMACPHVAGAAALLLHDTPSLNRDQIMWRLSRSGRKEVVGKLKSGDPDLLLWVSGDPAPAPVPTPAPPPPPTANCGGWCSKRYCAYPACNGCDYCR